MARSSSWGPSAYVILTRPMLRTAGTPESCTKRRRTHWLCGDLFTHLGDGPAVTTDDIVQPAMDAEAMFRASSLSPDTAIVMRKLGDLAPSTLALMHGSSFSGDGREVLYNLASSYESQYLTSS
jgi:hypothetical protein